MASMPPLKMGGPPPGTTPQGLSSMLPSGRPPEAVPGLGGPNEATPPGGGGGLKDVFDEVQGVLDALASILPESAQELDDIKVRLAEILAKAISGGTEFRGQEGGGLRTPATPSFPA
jgi:hypothetical protein